MRDFTKRQAKGKIKGLAKKLIPGITYALGCRGHPGLVIERCYHDTWPTRDLYGAGVTIKSLVDGIEQSCSLFSCSPQPIAYAGALYLAEQIKTVNAFDLAINQGCPLDEVIEWLNDWLTRGVLYWVVYTNDDGHSVVSNQAFTSEKADAEIAGMLSKNVRFGMKFGIPRKVHILNYPAVVQHPTLLEEMKYPTIEIPACVDKVLRAALKSSMTTTEVL